MPEGFAAADPHRAKPPGHGAEGQHVQELGVEEAKLVGIEPRRRSRQLAEVETLRQLIEICVWRDRV